jgi:hypothetical protein
MLAFVAGAKVAHAQPGYPAIVNKTLNIDITVIEPSMGCQLCHTSDQGNTTSLRPFGNMLVSRYGLMSVTVESAGADASLVTALQSLQADEPTLYKDLQMGNDPNPDVTNDPVPQYGCSSAPGRSDGAAILAVGFGLFALSAARRGRRRAR